MTTAVTLLNVPAKRCGAAELDCCHGTALCCRERRAVMLTIGFTVVAEYVRHFS
jgi:hypothetical protein